LFLTISKTAKSALSSLLGDFRLKRKEILKRFSDALGSLNSSS